MPDIRVMIERSSMNFFLSFSFGVVCVVSPFTFVVNSNLLLV